MDRARDRLSGDSAPGAPFLHLVFPGDAVSVRQALKGAMAALRDLDADGSRTGPVEVVLAEVLNNVVEHAYAGQGSGTIELDAERDARGVVFRIRDDGLPMPDGEVPAGRIHDFAGSTQDLPEGGFGWFLIRELTEDLRYCRCGARNELVFRIDIGAPAGDA